MNENKTAQYLKYAIGEIILVVIGILIALAINNWNEERKEASLEIQVLNEIVENLGADIKSLKVDINFNENLIKKIQFLEHELDSNKSLTDSILSGFGSISFNPTYSLKTSGYKNLSSIGFQIIVKDTIRKAITNLYETQYTFLKEREETIEKETIDNFKINYLNYFQKILFKTGDGNVNNMKKYLPKNYEDLKNDTDFRRLLDYNKELKYSNLFDINFVLKDIISTKNLIESYLNH